MIHNVVTMSGYIPSSDNISKVQFWVGTRELIPCAISRFSESYHHRFAGEVGNMRFRRGTFFQKLRRIGCVNEKIIQRINGVLAVLCFKAHSGTASCKIQLFRFGTARADTRSTLQPRSSTRSAQAPPIANASVPSATSYNRSISESGPSSPRATEPKSRIFVQPASASRALMAPAFSSTARDRGPGTGQQYHCGANESICPTPTRVEPMTSCPTVELGELVRAVQTWSPREFNYRRVHIH